MRVLAIGDIHGCHHALLALLDLVGPTSRDQLVTLGDVIDRGPHSREVLDTLITLRRSHQVVSLLGNHEALLMAADRDKRIREVWLSNGGFDTMASYGLSEDVRPFASLPDQHRDHIATACCKKYETDTHIFVHGSVMPGLATGRQSLDSLLWNRFDYGQPRHLSGKTVVCGHTLQPYGRPSVGKNSICIDTGAWAGLWLTCYDVTNQLFYQANELGKTRILREEECVTETGGLHGTVQ